LVQASETIEATTLRKLVAGQMGTDAVPDIIDLEMPLGRSGE
jgi:hypothetical protein